MKQERVFGLDLLRVIACYMVMQIHSGAFYIRGEDTEWVNLLNSFCRISVPLFVMITGYFVLPVKESVQTFFKKRFLRVAIPFIVWCSIYAVYHFLRGNIDAGTMFKNILGIFINYGVELEHLWYVYMLLGLYLLFPIISPWLKEASSKLLLFYLAIWGVTLCLPYIHLVYPAIWGECYWNDSPMLYYFTGFIGYAILGFYIKRFLLEKRQWQVPVGILLMLVGYAITYMVFNDRFSQGIIMPGLELSWGYNTINVGLMSLGAFLVMKNVGYSSSTLFNKWIVDLSLLSYGMFLFHRLALNGFMYLIDPYISAVWLKIPIITVCTFLISYLVIKLISFIPKTKYITG